MDANIYDTVFNTLISVLHRKMSLQAFSRWLYETDDVRYVINSEFYEELLGIDYLNTESITQVDRTIMSVLQRFQPNLYDNEYIRRILCKITSDAIDIVFACSELAQLHHFGYGWLPTVFVGLDSELDAGEAGQKPRLEHYRQIAKQEAQKLLSSRFADIPCT